MKITTWDIFRYIGKWKYIIVSVIIISILGTYFMVGSKQTYDSTVIITLNDDSVKEGKAPDNTPFDPYEIVSPNVLTDVIKELSLSMTVDAIRTRVKIEPIIPESETKIRESKEKDGEKYEYHPNTFSVTYKGTHSESTNNVRDILESIIKNYIEFYNRKYISLATINDMAYSEDMGDYDYIDMAEMLNDNLSDITVKLNKYYDKNRDFRSTITGLTFKDLINEYNYLKEFKIPEIYSDIFKGQITKNKQRLIEVYTQKAEEYMVAYEGQKEGAEIAKSRMESFSNANKDVPNAYNNSKDDKVGIEIVGELNRKNETGNTTTTYDELINSYADKMVLANDKKLDAEHCKDIINKFTSPLKESVNTGELTTKIAHNLISTKTKMIELNKKANQVINDYNKVEVTAHVSPLTGVNYYGNISLSLYTLIVVFVMTFLTLVIAITWEIVKEMKKAKKE